MAELKTRPTDASVEEFLSSIDDESRRRDCVRVLELMRNATAEEPRMWGDSIVGFGRYHYRYATGNQGEWFIAGFSPRKKNLTLYIMAGFDGYGDLMSRLGKHSTGRSCLYVKNLADIDMDVLRELVAASVAHVRQSWSTI